MTWIHTNPFQSWIPQVPPCGLNFLNFPSYTNEPNQPFGWLKKTKPCCIKKYTCLSSVYHRILYHSYRSILSHPYKYNIYIFIHIPYLTHTIPPEQLFPNFFWFSKLPRLFSNTSPGIPTWWVPICSCLHSNSSVGGEKSRRSPPFLKGLFWRGSCILPFIPISHIFFEDL